MIPTVAYFRKSSDDDGGSIAQQRDWARAAAGREGLAVSAEFEDQSIAGWDTARRSGFQAMLTHCQDHHRRGTPVRVILCWAANRFSRSDSLETARMLCEFRDAGVHRMLTAERWIDFNRPEDRMIFGLVQEATNHKYAADLSRDTKRGKLARAAAGGWGGGKPPFGYAVEAGKLVPHPSEAQVVRWLFTTYATEDVSLWGLVARLRDRSTPSPTGKPLWLSATVSKLLRNELYLGDYLYGRKDYTPDQLTAVVVPANTVKASSGRPKPRDAWGRVENSHPALIARETFGRVQERLNANRQRKSPRKTAPFALSGLMSCGQCGRRMIAQTSHVRRGETVHKYRFYTCVSYHRNGAASGCGRNTVEEGKMVGAVAKKLGAGFETPEAIAALKAEIRRQDAEAAGTTADQRPAITARLADLDRRMTRLVKQLGDDLPDDGVSVFRVGRF